MKRKVFFLWIFVSRISVKLKFLNLCTGWFPESPDEDDQCSYSWWTLLARVHWRNSLDWWQFLHCDWPIRAVKYNKRFIRLLVVLHGVSDIKHCTSLPFFPILFCFFMSYSCVAPFLLVSWLTPMKNFWGMERILFLQCYLLGMLCMFLSMASYQVRSIMLVYIISETLDSPTLEQSQCWLYSKSSTCI